MSQQQQPLPEPMVDEMQDEADLEEENNQFSDDFHSEDENPQPNLDDNEQQAKASTIPKVSNPISAYGVFTKMYREMHPGEKLSITGMAEVWKQLTSQEREVYERKFAEEKKKYEEYEATMLAIDPNFGKKNKLNTNNYFFPLHRVKSIMKQDPDFTTTTENITAMARTVEYFGEYLLEEVKKVSKGNKRLDAGELFETINNNQSNLWFLNCLIDEHNIDNQASHKAPTTINKKPQKVQKVDRNQENQAAIEKAIKSEKKKSVKVAKQLPKGQLKLSDMF